MYGFIIFILVCVLFYCIHELIFIIRGKRLVKDALEYGIYDSIWASRKKYSVKKGLYDEYILTEEGTNDTMVVSEMHLFDCLIGTKGMPSWPIAYPGSQPAELKINNNTRAHA